MKFNQSKWDEFQFQRNGNDFIFRHNEETLKLTTRSMEKTMQQVLSLTTITLLRIMH